MNSEEVALLLILSNRTCSVFTTDKDGSLLQRDIHTFKNPISLSNQQKRVKGKTYTGVIYFKPCMLCTLQSIKPLRKRKGPNPQRSFPNSSA